MAVDARPSDAIALALRAKAPIFVEDRSSTRRRPPTSRPTRRTPSACRNGSRASTRTNSASTRCSAALGRHRRSLANRPARRDFAPLLIDTSAPPSLQWRRPGTAHPRPSPHDRCDRKPEGRRRQDDDRHQPGGGAVDARQADAADRPRSAGEQLDVVSGRPAITRSVYDAIAEPNVRVRRRDPAVDAAEPVHRAVADCAGQARGEAGGGARRAFPAEGSARADPRASTRTS